jgi:hypothetical protein
MIKALWLMSMDVSLCWGISFLLWSLTSFSNTRFDVQDGVGTISPGFSVPFVYTALLRPPIMASIDANVV